MATSTASNITNLPVAEIEDFALEILPLVVGSGEAGAYFQRLTCELGVWIRKIDGPTIGDWKLLAYVTP